MKRRAFLRNAAGAGVSLGLLGASESKFAGAQTPTTAAPASCEKSFPQVPKLTTHTAEFVVNLKFADIPRKRWNSARSRFWMVLDWLSAGPKPRPGN